MLKTVHIKKNERGLVLKHGDLVSVLGAGQHTLWDFKQQLQVKIVPVEQPISDATLIDALHYAPASVLAAFHHLKLSRDELAVAWYDDQIQAVVQGVQHLYWWKDAQSVRYERLDTRTLHMPATTLAYFDAKLMQNKAVQGLDQILVIDVPEHQIALISINQQWSQVLGHGRYGFYRHQAAVGVKYLSIVEPIRKAAEMDELRQALVNTDPTVQSRIHKIEVPADQVALRYVDGMLCEILAPHQQLYVVDHHQAVHFEWLPLNGVQVPASLLDRLTPTVIKQGKMLGLEHLVITEIPEHFVGLVSVDGQWVETRTSGRYADFQIKQRVLTTMVDLRLQELEVSGQEILTKDKVTLRVNVSVNWQYQDAYHAYQQHAQPERHLYVSVQLAIRELIATRSLDDLLENKHALDQVLGARVNQLVADLGIAVVYVGIKDLILPGEMRTILAQVVEAQKSSEANVIRRREETAATRSLLNTAKVMEDNPVALRLKELETLERMAERIERISVFGGLDQVLNGLIKIEPSRQV